MYEEYCHDFNEFAWHVLRTVLYNVSCDRRFGCMLANEVWHTGRVKFASLSPVTSSHATRDRSNTLVINDMPIGGKGELLNTSR